MKVQSDMRERSHDTKREGKADATGKVVSAGDEHIIANSVGEVFGLSRQQAMPKVALSEVEPAAPEPLARPTPNGAGATLGFRASAAPPAKAIGTQPSDGELHEIAGQRLVLLIDDQPARREAIRQIIFGMGFYVYVADSLEEAMSKYKGLADLVIDMTDEDATEIERNLQILQGNIIKLQGLDEEAIRDKVNEWLIDQWRQTQA